MRNLIIVLITLTISAYYCSEDDQRIDISYTADQLRSIRSTLGGIGTGSIVLDGCGSIREFDLLQHPFSEKENDLLSFFALHIAGEDNEPVVRLLERDCTDGVPGSLSEGMLRQPEIQGFREAVFHNAYPLVNIDLLDEAVSLKVTMNAWSPLIPVDPLNSKLPSAVIEWELVNTERKKMAYSILLMMENPLQPDLQGDTTHIERIGITSQSDSGWKGITFSNYQGESPGSASGAIRIMSPGRNNMSVVRFRNRADAAEHFIREFLTDGDLKNQGDDDSQTGNESGVAAIHISGILHPGKSVNIPFLFAWYMPLQKRKSQSVNILEEEVAVKSAVSEMAESTESIVETADKGIAKGKMENERTEQAKVTKEADDSKEEDDDTKETAVKEKADIAVKTAGMAEVANASNENDYDQRFTDIDHLSGCLVKEFENLRKKTLQFSHAIITSTVPPGVVDTMMTDMADAIEKRKDFLHFLRNPMKEVGRGSDTMPGMTGWDRYREMTGYSYEEETQVMKISPVIDVLPVRYFWSTNTGWGTVNISRAAIVLECIHGSLDLRKLTLEGRSFFVFREFVPSQDAVISYSDEALSIAFPERILLDEEAVFRMEIP
ncbi:MAG: GH116 family glycosyl-hydrolase [Bacteroidales bacterium]